MKALSIREPWASAIVDGKKSIECRNWYTNFRGEFYVHASKSYSDGAPIILRTLYPKEKCKLGYLIGKATLLDVYHYESDREFEQDDHFHLVSYTHEELGDAILERSEYGFVLVDMKRIEPIQAKGALNFFEYPAKSLRTKADELAKDSSLAEEMRT